MENETLLTIYTPTYNRQNLLKRVYESLKAQSVKNFKWLVIDDGSTDETKNIVQQWQRYETEFDIIYHFKENGGIHTARDAAYHLVDTELILGVDSDDWLLPDAVENIYRIWNEKETEDAIGIFATSIYEDGTRICPEFPKELKTCTCQEFLYKYKLNSDTVNVLKTSVMNSLVDAPSFPNEKLIGEGFKMIQIPDRPFIVKDVPMQVKEYQNNGYSVEGYAGVFKNPRGFREDYRMHMIHAHYFKPKMRGILGYIVCSLMIKDKEFVKNSPNKVLTVLLFPLGIVTLIYLKYRLKKQIKIKIKSQTVK